MAPESRLVRDSRVMDGVSSTSTLAEPLSTIGCFGLALLVRDGLLVLASAAAAVAAVYVVTMLVWRRPPPAGTGGADRRVVAGIISVATLETAASAPTSVVRSLTR